MKPTIGLMLVVRNEAKRIAECLEWHVPYVDEVVVVDQLSDDGTWEILQQMQDTSPQDWTITQDKNWGYCEPSKQKAADMLTTDWILYVDPDEKFPKVFLEQMHEIVANGDATYDGYRFPRYNFFDVQIFDDNVPIKPKWLRVQHPAKDPQLRLTRKSVSRFPIFLHHRVRIHDEKGNKRMFDLPYPIEHVKTVREQLNDNDRYLVVNARKAQKEL